MKFETRAIRVGQDPESDYKSITQPIYQTSTFGWSDLDHIPPIDYTRCQNPNRQTLELVLASLENAAHCTLFSSGMAAVAGVFSLLKAGDHLLIARDIYGGTFRLGEVVLPRQGIEVSFFDPAHPESLAGEIKANTRMLIFESPTNPTLRVFDITAICAVAKAKGVISVFDNTFASPALLNPLDHGADIVLHSTTKYISGHSDVVGGAVMTNNPAFGEAMFEWNKAVGSIPSPFDSWLSLRGVKTLSLRMERHCSNALAVAQYLEAHPKVESVHYPGLESHPDHALAKRQMRGFGGMVSFTLSGGVASVDAFSRRTKVFLLAESLGGIESLVAYPPKMSHATMSEEQRLAAGIPPHLLRLSVGIEHIDDLLADLGQALS